MYTLHIKVMLCQIYFSLIWHKFTVTVYSLISVIMSLLVESRNCAFSKYFFKMYVRILVLNSKPTFSKIVVSGQVNNLHPS